MSGTVVYCSPEAIDIPFLDIPAKIAVIFPGSNCDRDALYGASLLESSVSGSTLA